MQQAIAVLEATGLDRAASGTTVEMLRQVLATMQRGEPLGGGGSGPSTLPAEQIRVTVSNTIAVLTSLPEKHAEWRGAIEEQLQHAQQQGPDWQIEVEFYTAVLAFLDGQPASLPQGHPYAEAVAAIGQGIAATFAQLEQLPDLPFDPQIIPRSIAALRGGPQEKMGHAQYLTALATQSDDAQVKALVNTIQTALFGGSLDSLGGDLEGAYAQAWAAIVAGIQQGDTQQ
jgi:hypothetical protein